MISASAAQRAFLAFLALAAAGPARRALAADGTPSTVASPLTYDARTLALGGAGVALTNSGAAGAQNPALVGLTAVTDATATFTPYVLRLEAPFTFANGDTLQIRSGNLFGPFAQLGVNVRLHRRVVVGMVAFINAAAGGVFERIPLSTLAPDEAPKGIVGNARVAQVAGELRVPVAVQVTRWLQLAAAYRVTAGYALAQISSGSGARLSEANLRGTNVLGFALGVLALPHPRVRLGVSYRSQTSVDLSGTLKTFAGNRSTEVGLSRRKAVNTPHELKLGAVWNLPRPSNLLLTGEVRLASYHLLNHDERNVVGMGLGSELKVKPWLAMRFGYSLTMQPTRDAFASPFAAPPGLGHGALVGSGVQLGDWSVDAAVGFVRSGKHIATGQNAGNYLVRGLVASASASYAI